MNILIVFGLLAIVAAYGKIHFEPFLQTAIKDAPIQLLRDCKVIPDANGCEDVRIDEGSGTVILACSNIASRFKWFPPLAYFEPEIMPYDYFTTYNLKNGKSAKLSTPGFSSQLRTHGLGMRRDEEDPGKLNVFAVNHKYNGSVIDLFSHKIGSTTLDHRKTVQHELIKFPNSVAVLNRDAFYVTNDHSHKDGVWRLVEDMLSLKHSNVVKWEAGSAKIVAQDIPYANGLDFSPDRKQLFVASSSLPGIYVYNITSSHDLDFQYSIKTKLSPDNVHIDSNGDIWITGLLNLIKFAQQTKNPAIKSPSATLRLRRNSTTGQWQQKYIMSDDGSALATGTSGLPSRKHDAVVFSGVFNEDSFVCAKALSRIDTLEKLP